MPCLIWAPVTDASLLQSMRPERFAYRLVAGPTLTGPRVLEDLQASQESERLLRFQCLERRPKQLDAALTGNCLGHLSLALSVLGHRPTDVHIAR